MALLDGADWAGQIYSSGWTAAQGGTLQTFEPATGEVLAEVGLANKGDVAQAARAASAAQPAWAARTGPERAALIRQAARILEDNHEEFET
jgi:benzaldehyde dehydrogenase (NAD)